jgi:hypothetical protein
MNIGNSSKEILNSRNEKIEMDKLNSEINASLFQTVSIELGAIGLGTLSHLLLPTLAFEITGILSASLIGILGLYSIPMKKTKMRKEFKKNLESLKEKLLKEMDNQFKYDLNHTITSINDSISPYSRFVRSESNLVKQQLNEFSHLSSSLNDVKLTILHLNEEEKEIN